MAVTFFSMSMLSSVKISLPIFIYKNKVFMVYVLLVLVKLVFSISLSPLFF